MKLRFKVGLALAGLAMISTVALAGLWPGFPIVGIGTVCWGSSTTTGAVTACPNTAPAGPSIVSGNELIPADVYNSTTGAPGRPATILLSLASLNALPITVQTVPAGGVTTALSAGNTVGGIFYVANATITSANVTLPALPIDGQQFKIGTNGRILSVLNIDAGTATMGNGIPRKLSPTATGQNSGVTLFYNAANTTWYELQ